MTWDRVAIVDRAEVGMRLRVAADLEGRLRGEVTQLIEVDELEPLRAQEPLTRELVSPLPGESDDSGGDEEHGRQVALRKQRRHGRVPGGVAVIERQQQLGPIAGGAGEPGVDPDDLML